ncbi:MAG TPA: hypothetical protein VKF38_03870 [Anaerolineaceae bacterium]|nr:hypothetical protein [Anaerolineaceae bacterium]
MMDVKSYKSLHLVAQRHKRSTQEIASQLFDQAVEQLTTQT